MKIINFEEYNSLRNELNEFVVLCRKYNYTPSKDEFDDAIRFILLQSGSGTTTLCESYETNPFKLLGHLYESFEFDESNILNEAKGQEAYTGEKDFDSATGTATTIVKGAGKAAAGALGAAGTGIGMAAVNLGTLIGYLWKKGKVRSAINKEKDAEMKKLDGFIKLAELKKKLSSLDPSASTKISFSEGSSDEDSNKRKAVKPDANEAPATPKKPASNEAPTTPKEEVKPNKEVNAAEEKFTAAKTAKETAEKALKDNTDESKKAELKKAVKDATTAFTTAETNLKTSKETGGKTPTPTPTPTDTSTKPSKEDEAVTAAKTAKETAEKALKDNTDESKRAELEKAVKDAIEKLQKAEDEAKKAVVPAK